MTTMLALLIGLAIGALYGRDEARAVTIAGFTVVVLSALAFLVDEQWAYAFPGMALGGGALVGMTLRLGTPTDDDVMVESTHEAVPRAGVIRSRDVLGTALMVVAVLVAACGVWLGALVIESFGEPTDGSAIVFAAVFVVVGLTAALGARALLPAGWRRGAATVALWTIPPFALLLVAASA